MKNQFSKLFVFASLVLFISNCSGGAPSGPDANDAVPLAPGNHQGTIKVDGTLRSYLLHVPASYDGSQALPLVFVLHGAGGSPGGIAQSSQMSAKADQENFFVAYLAGTKVLADELAWNSGLSPDLGLVADDVVFVREMVGHLNAQILVDENRVYAAGHSNGAFMCHRLAAELPDVLAGVAAVAGTIGTSQDEGDTFLTIPAPKGPMPILMIHGELDPTVRYYGGQGTGRIYAKSVAEALEFWTTADGCAGEPRIEIDENITATTYPDCADGTEVRLITVADGHHEWPTAEGPTGFSATDAIWEFFSRHSL